MGVCVCLCVCVGGGGEKYLKFLYMTHPSIKSVAPLMTAYIFFSLLIAYNRLLETVYVQLHGEQSEPPLDQLGYYIICAIVSRRSFPVSFVRKRTDILEYFFEISTIFYTRPRINRTRRLLSLRRFVG